MGEATEVTVEMVVLVSVYILPALIGYHRHHRNGNAIMALNLLAGWTVVGWIIALVWSLTDNVAAKTGVDTDRRRYRI